MHQRVRANEQERASARWNGRMAAVAHASTESTVSAAPDAEGLIAELLAGAARRARAPWTALTVFLVYLVVTFLTVMWFTAQRPHVVGPALLSTLLTAGAACLCVLCLGWRMASLTWAEKVAARQLADCTDPRCVGQLLDASGIADRRTQGAIVRALIASLGRLAVDESVHLT